MIVISDSSPIINLAKVNHLNLLPELYSTIILPKAVYREIVILGEGEPGSEEIKNAKWVEVKKCRNQNFLEKLSKILDAGEAEAISLSIEMQADFLLIDEKKGREIARQNNIRITGLLGVLLSAKEENFIPEVKELMVELRNKAEFWISEETFREVLKIAKE